MPSEKESLLVSACLLGVPCRYDGGSKPNHAVLALREAYQLIPVCPEIYGGLPTPRPPAERKDGRVMTKAGADVTQAYCRGGSEALRLTNLFGCKAAVLKEHSPSCGAGSIYDGSFSGRLIPGDGMTTEMLKEKGIRVYGESDVERGALKRE